VDLILILLGGVLLTFMLGGGRARYRAAALGGRRVRAELAAAYGGEHEYADVAIAELPDLDHEFYREASRAFEALGFRKLADLEDVTLSRIYPDSRTVLRIFVDDARLIRAGLYHVRPRGALVALLQLVRVVPRHLRIVELVSEAPRGTFASTSNTAGLAMLEPPPEAKCDRLPATATIEALVTHHRDRLTAMLRRDPSLAPVMMDDRDAMLESVQRSNVAAARHREKLGGLSRDELERMRGRPLDDADEVFLREVQARSREG
jgi:hypothetical protein